MLTLNENVSLDYSACNSCAFKKCVFDNNTLSRNTQDNMCPAIVKTHKNRKNGDYKKWRREKLQEIKNIIKENGPTSLVELSDLVSVNLSTMRSWRLYFMKTVLVTNPHMSRKEALVSFVSLTAIDRPSGHKIRKRQRRLDKIEKILINEGPLPLVEIKKRLGIKQGTLNYWLGKYITGQKYRVFHKGHNREIVFIESVIKS
jgi:predicted transcriptional regulator